MYLGVVFAAMVAESDEEELQAIMPERHGRFIIDAFVFGEKFEFLIADLDDVGCVPNAFDLFAGLIC